MGSAGTAKYSVPFGLTAFNSPYVFGFIEPGSGNLKLACA